MSALPKSIVIMNENRRDDVFGPKQMAQITRLTEMVAKPVTGPEVKENPGLLSEVEVIFGGWGMPVMDATLLDAAPNLRAIFYSAGTVKSFVTDEVYARDIVVTNAHVANAVPVAEFCVATILFSLKLGWRHLRRAWVEKRWKRDTEEIVGCYDAKVGLVSLGAIGKNTLELLKPYRLDLLVYSTSMKSEAAEKLGVRLAGLEEIFRECDVVSLHTPALPSTHHMIKGDHFKMMRPHATFINTARGAVVDQTAMIAALRERPDLTAVIDVTDPEPPPPGDDIYSVQNLVLTPHIAGSLGQECLRLGQTAIDEFNRFQANEALRHPVLHSDLVSMA